MAACVDRPAIGALKLRRRSPKQQGMSSPLPVTISFLDDHRGTRQHRFMESADLNAAFRELFKALRQSIRRGITDEGQVYAIEVDTCIPGALLAIEWVSLASRGIVEPALLAHPRRRRALFDELLAEQRPEAMFAYVCENLQHGQPVLSLEIVSADGWHAADYPIRASERYRRELVRVPHHRVNPITTA